MDFIKVLALGALVTGFTSSVNAGLLPNGVKGLVLGAPFEAVEAQAQQAWPQSTLRCSPHSFRSANLSCLVSAHPLADLTYGGVRLFTAFLYFKDQQLVGVLMYALPDDASKVHRAVIDNIKPSMPRAPDVEKLTSAGGRIGWRSQTQVFLSTYVTGETAGVTYSTTEFFAEHMKQLAADSKKSRDM